MLRILGNSVATRAFPAAAVPKSFPQLRQQSVAAAAQTNSLQESTAKPDALYKSVQLEVRCGEPAILKSYEWFVLSAAKNLGISIGECWTPPKPRHDRLTVLKSVHIYKKHRVQYEVRTYFRYMTFLKLTGSTSDTFLEYIQRNLPEGVGMKVTKNAIEPLPETIKKLRS
nr:EOG090X0GP9 [Eulimnadia texana]